MHRINLKGKTVLITGPTSGIGKETARELARRGARVILGCITQTEGEAARADIVEDTRNQDVHVKVVDLASFESIREFANSVNKDEKKIDILINNAGLLTYERKETKEGFEMVFGVNYIGHFLLTNLILDKVKAAAPGSRIVTVASDWHRGKDSSLDFEDFYMNENYSGYQAYGRSKTALILFSMELAHILRGTGVTTYSLHPGVVNTSFQREFPHMETGLGKCIFACVVRCCMCQKFLGVEDGALTTLFCALDSSVAYDSGKYYVDRREVEPAAHASDPTVAKRLWEVSEVLTGLKTQHQSHRSSVISI